MRHFVLASNVLAPKARISRDPTFLADLDGRNR